jgi:hypothetical protein
MDIQEFKDNLAQLRMPMDSLVVLQLDAEGNDYMFLEYILKDARYVASCPWAGRVYSYGCDQPSEPCILLGAHVDKEPIKLGTLIQEISSVTSPTMVIIMPDHERPLTGVARDVFKIYWSASRGNTIVPYDDDDDDDDEVVQVAECVVLYPIN